AARLILAAGLSAAVFIVATLLLWRFETGRPGGDIHGLGDATFFTAVQLLTVSSYFHSPVTSVGKVIDVGLEMWSVFVITAIAGSFSAFFSAGDSH
ncbi:MAG TPA: hypothetical protein VE441_11490, partial [Mycobacterium sp.]|nr:hypothetical protein [Mycobacterium sp.]